MDRRKFLQWSSFLTVTIATSGLTACGGGDDDPAPNPQPPAPENASFAQGVASGDPRADSVVLWTRVEGGNGNQSIPVRLQVSTQQDFSTLVVNTTLTALPEWDYTVRNKVTGLNAATTYYYRFQVGDKTSPVGRTRTAPLPGTPLSQLRFAVVSCQDWGINHWAGMEELAAQELDFIVHVGDYVYESVIGGFPVDLVERRHTALTFPDGGTQENGTRFAVSLADYRYLYKTYRSDTRLQALHAACPIIAVWDDHEFTDDAWQDRQTYTATDDQNPVTARRRSASQAWYEFMPADVSIDLNNPSFLNIQIYRDFTFGDLATLVMTDERLYRADHIISEASTGGALGSRFLVRQSALQQAEDQKIAAAGNTLTPVSMLGDAQRAWWQDKMGGATTTWKLWGNQVSLLRMQVDGLEAVARLAGEALILARPTLAPARDSLRTSLAADFTTAKNNGTYPNVEYTQTKAVAANYGVTALDFDTNLRPQLNSRLPSASLLEKLILNADQWDGYNAERKALMAFLKNTGIQNVVALTGDIHAFFAGTVLDDYDAATGVPVMVDLVTAGMSSNSLQNTYKNVVDSRPELAGLKALVYENVNGVAMNTMNATLRTFNPWLAHVDTSVQGYALVTLTATGLSCSFHRMKPLVDGNAPPQPATESVTTVQVPAGAATVNVV